MKKKISAIALALVLISGFGYLSAGNLVIAYHNNELKKSIVSINSEKTTLNEVVPFTWDTVYTFSPYTNKAEIEKEIGFKSRYIRETASENMVQLLFVKNDSVVASICGYEDNLGYRISFPDKVIFDEKAEFAVYQKNDEGTILLVKNERPV